MFFGLILGILIWDIVHEARHHDRGTAFLVVLCILLPFFANFVVAHTVSFIAPQINRYASILGRNALISKRYGTI